MTVDFALSIFPRCTHGLVRGEGTACGELAHYRIGNCFYCADHRVQPGITAYPILGEVQFGFPTSATFYDLCDALGMPRPPMSRDDLSRWEARRRSEAARG